MFVACLSFFAQAQATGPLDYVYTKEGSVYRGEIKQYIQGEFVEIQLGTGDVIRVMESDIKKIKQGKLENYFF